MWVSECWCCHTWTLQIIFALHDAWRVCVVRLRVDRCLSTAAILTWRYRKLFPFFRDEFDQMSHEEWKQEVKAHFESRNFIGAPQMNMRCDVIAATYTVFLFNVRYVEFIEMSSHRVNPTTPKLFIVLCKKFVLLSTNVLNCMSIQSMCFSSWCHVLFVLAKAQYKHSSNFWYVSCLFKANMLKGDMNNA